MAVNRHVTQPIAYDRTRNIENVYPDPNGDPDTQSRDQFDRYLIDRKYPDRSVTRHYVPGEGRYTTRRERGWLLKPKTAIAITVAGLIALNVHDNRGFIADKIKDFGNGVENFFLYGDSSDTPPADKPDNPGPRFVRVQVPGVEQRSGIAEDAGVTVNRLANLVKKSQDDKSEVEKVTIIGSASDEWMTKHDLSLAVEDQENAALSHRRASRVTSALSKLFKQKNVQGVEIEQTSAENVLTDRQLGRLYRLSTESGFSDVSSAIVAYNAGQKLPGPLRRSIRRQIGSKRTVTARFDYETAGEGSNNGNNPGVEAQEDNDEPFDFRWFGIPPIPYWRRKRFDTYGKPTILEKVPERVWLELYDEAMTSSGDLKDEAWFYSRKYQALLREERIKRVLNMEFKDVDGNDQQFNVVFVDHEPEAESVAAVEELMKTIAHVKDGQLAHRLNAIAIYPSETCGTVDPKEIGLGIDEEFDQGILGVAIPTINLVEINMPSKPTLDDIEKFYGLKWTIAHEVAGHFTDVDEGPTWLRSVAGENSNWRYYEANDPWLDRAEQEYESTGRRAFFMAETTQFAITDLRDEDDKTQTDEYLVNGDDPALLTADWVRIRNLPVTRYAETSPAELYAETIAQGVTGIKVPFEESEIEIDTEDTLSGGYSADASHIHAYRDPMSSLANTDNYAWSEDRRSAVDNSWRVTEVDVNTLDKTYQMSETAKNTPYQPDEKRLKILGFIKE